MEHKTKAIKMNDEINRNYFDETKYIVEKIHALLKAIIYLRREEFQIE